VSNKREHPPETFILGEHLIQEIPLWLLGFELLLPQQALFMTWLFIFTKISETYYLWNVNVPTKTSWNLRAIQGGGGTVALYLHTLKP